MPGWGRNRSGSVHDSWSELSNRTRFTRDNFDVPRGLNSECVDLIHLDLQFNSTRDYGGPIGSKAGGAAFRDAWTQCAVDTAWVGRLADKQPALASIIGSQPIRHVRRRSDRTVHLDRLGPAPVRAQLGSVSGPALPSLDAGLLSVEQIIQRPQPLQYLCHRHSAEPSAVGIGVRYTQLLGVQLLRGIHESKLVVRFQGNVTSYTDIGMRWGPFLRVLAATVPAEFNESCGTMFACPATIRIEPSKWQPAPGPLC